MVDIINRVREALGNKSVNAGEITARIPRDYSVEQIVTLQMLSIVTVKSILSHLVGEGYVEAVFSERGVL
ncbi:MAG: hypothetical protein ABWW65_01380 [Thermoprotei archaeon]